MKNTLYRLTSIAIFALLLNSCSDDNTPQAVPNGNFIGTFTVEYSDGTVFSNPVEVNFDESNKYTSSKSANRMPAGGQGVYEVKNSSIEFHEPNFWTADFDWNLILSGSYNYSSEGNSLTISANRTFGIYTYELIKQ